MKPFVVNIVEEIFRQSVKASYDSEVVDKIECFAHTGMTRRGRARNKKQQKAQVRWWKNNLL